MTPIQFVALLFLISIAAGGLDALLELGGGIIIIPTLTLLFGIDIRYAIGASIVSVLATSSETAAAYVRERMANIRVAMVLETATTGALSSAFLTRRLGGRGLYSILMAYSSLMMYRKNNSDGESSPSRPAPWADYLRLHSHIRFVVPFIRTGQN